MIAEHGEFQIGPVVYATTVALTALSLVAMALVIDRRRLASDTPSARYQQMARGLLVTCGVFAVTIPLPFVAGAGAAKWAWLVLAIVTRPLENRLTRRQT
jgi:hypothetical protein